ncbi:MAG: nucleotide exchange factor GrpE [Erysipelotrichaceae bacterium]|nr:nucleotide exchange factor GrpE [Erysipelotrichaceae bacterium]
MQENEMKQDEKEVKQEGKEAEAIKTDEQQTADKEKTVQAKPKAAKKKKLQELEAEIVALKEELAVSKNAYFKAYADADNMKKRLQAEADNVRKYRIQSFASEVLPVLDSLERALDVKVDDQNLKNYVKGFEMIYTQLKSVLEKEGVCEIEALDKPFDPNFHNALMQEKREGVESGIVIEVLQKGYMLKDRVLRATLVKVSE